MTTHQELTLKSMLSGLSLPTLQEISLASIAIQLMENEEVKKIYYEHFSLEMTVNNFSDTSVATLTFLCKSLQLPDILEAKLFKCFHWINDQYFSWIWFVKSNLGQLQEIFPKRMEFITYIMNTVKWSNGAIDKEKSIHEIILFKNTKIKHKDPLASFEMFRMASRFCLEDDLKIMWEKMPPFVKDKSVIYCTSTIRDFFTLYWICKMKRDMSEFMKIIPGHYEARRYLEAEVDYKDPNIYAFVLHIFEGEISGVKYFNKLANVDIERRVDIIRKLFKKLYPRGLLKCYPRQELERCVNKVHLLLNEIEDEGILKEIFHEFFKVFLMLSASNWSWSRFFLPLLRMYGDSIDKFLFHDLLAQLLNVVEMKKANIFEVKMLWKSISSEVKISICSHISNTQKGRHVRDFWKKMTIEVFEMFLNDEQFRNTLTPYENCGVLECIEIGRYDLIEFWLQKCLVAEEAIVSYFQWFIETQSISVINNSSKDSLCNLNKFLDWAFKYEDVMSRDELLKVKDEVINGNSIKLFVDGLSDEKNWEDCKKFMDWMLRNRNHEYESEFVNWKQKVIEIFFLRLCDASGNDLKHSLRAFLSYRVNDPGKIKIMMDKANLNENKICSNYLSTSFVLISNYLSFIEGYGKDMLSLKENIFNFIFNDYVEPHLFLKDKYCENMRKLLYWNCESDQEMKAKVEEIKETIITKGAVEKIVRCVGNYSSRGVCLYLRWDIVMNNILKFLFENKLENEDWSKMLFDLKIKVIELIEMSCSNYVWREKKFYDIMIVFINYGKEYENIRKKNWDVKKYLIECLKNKIQEKQIPQMILFRNFVASVLEGDEARPDFEEISKNLRVFSELGCKQK